MKNIFLIDGSGFIFRAFYALPPLTSPDGIPINAVYGYCNMITSIVEKFKPDQLIVVFDTKKKTFRNDIYKFYKSNRSEPPEELIPQFSIIREATEAFDLPQIEMDGFEADDIIATYAKEAQKKGIEVTILSSDKDFMQLINNQTKIPFKLILIEYLILHQEFLKNKKIKSYNNKMIKFIPKQYNDKLKKTQN